ncbi:hypothetical protein ACFFGV_19625 [Pontibacillus salicampi]|uniref:Uncharacterized protein n=1 Tax=Pontibacillus salicampi TaxID=1449801 RepID=A0ABV6LTQ3_9BACI
MEIEQARDRIQELENFIHMVEHYDVDSMEKEAILLYVLRESVNKVADEMNQKGYRIGKRKLRGKDVTNIIMGVPMDPIHENAQKWFKSSKRHAR